MAEKLTISLTVLLTGFAVVFAVLLLLIGVIKLYGTIVYNAQQKSKAEAEKNASKDAEDMPSSPVAVVEAPASADEGEIIAVISAAVYSMYSDGKVKIKSIRRSTPRSGAWRNAGLSDNVRPF